MIATPAATSPSLVLVHDSVWCHGSADSTSTSRAPKYTSNYQDTNKYLVQMAQKINYVL